MPQKLLATPEMAAEYSRWFVNRLAYTRQSDRPHPDSGRHFYYRPGSKNGAEIALQPDDVRRHLAGEITLGVYAINPTTQRVKWMARWRAKYQRPQPANSATTLMMIRGFILERPVRNANQQTNNAETKKDSANVGRSPRLDCLAAVLGVLAPAFRPLRFQSRGRSVVLKAPCALAVREALQLRRPDIAVPHVG